jgi:lipid-binding SYLF domain-containing protein
MHRHDSEVVMSKFRNLLETIKKPVEKLEELKPFHALEKEAKLGPVLHAEVLAALKQLQQKHPEIKKVLSESAGYAVIPEIGRASLVLGGAYGLGEVFQHDRVIGYAAIVELTIGVQVGGTTFHELVVFHDEGSLKRFKSGKFAFAADAAVEIVKAGAQASRGFGASSSIYVFADGGMLLDLAIGGQKFIFKPAALGRTRTAEGGLEEEHGKEAAPEEEEDQERGEADEDREAPAEEERPGQHA